MAPCDAPFSAYGGMVNMTSVSASMVKGAQSAMQRLAGRLTPLIYNEWYVAATRSELGRSLLRRKILDRSVVLFRTQAGFPVAMANRCPHRSYPLSSGTLEGDSIVCGYHGMRIDPKGDCTDYPAVAQCPKKVGVRTYLLVERGPMCWIWMGDPEKADPARIPAPAWMSDEPWVGGAGYFLMKGSYVSLHENLLDTSHLSFLHAKTIGSPDYVKAPFTTEITESYFALNRLVYPTILPEALGKLTGLGGKANVARAVKNEFVSPAYYEATTRMYDASLSDTDRKEFTIRAAHMPTPESLTSTHYFIYVARNFAQEDVGSKNAMLARLMAAFEEDVIALALQEEMQREAGDELFELSFPSDELTIAMRRYIKSRAETEASPS
jgi:phenylpropionate dioxygenase-like ring-hydroxylating dioxygenase large terminal subunit